MIYFFAGFATGAVTALFSAYCMNKAKTKAAGEKEISQKEARLNAEKEERAELLKKLERQFDNMMKYTGKEQI